jgi:hypothetical protein
VTTDRPSTTGAVVEAFNQAAACHDVTVIMDLSMPSAYFEAGDRATVRWRFTWDEPPTR